MPMIVSVKDNRKSIIIDYPSIVDIHEELSYEWDKKKRINLKSMNNCNLAVFGEISARLAEALKNEVSIVVPHTLQEVTNPVNSVPSYINMYSKEKELLIYRTHLKISDIDNISSNDESVILAQLRNKLAYMEHKKELEEIKKDFWGLAHPEITIVGVSFTKSYINIDWCLVNEYYINIKA